MGSIGSRIESEVKKYVESLFKKLHNEDDGGHRLLAEEKDVQNPQANGSDEEKLEHLLISTMKKEIKHLEQKLEIMLKVNDNDEEVEEKDGEHRFLGKAKSKGKGKGKRNQEVSKNGGNRLLSFVEKVLNGFN